MDPNQNKDLQVFIGNFLRYGVLSAICIALIGLGFYFFEHRGEPIDYSTFREGAFVRPGAYFSALSRGDSDAWLNLAIMMLIATPILRVVFTGIGFFLQKDRLYTFIASLVLATILISMFLEASS